MTNTEITALRSASAGPALVSAMIAGKLYKSGFAEKDGPSGRRGVAKIRITDAGRAALKQAA